MSKTGSDNHRVLEDDTNDENGVGILKINKDLRTQRMIWGFPAKNPPTAAHVSLQTYPPTAAHVSLQTFSDGYWITPIG